MIWRRVLIVIATACALVTAVVVIIVGEQQGRITALETATFLDGAPE